MRGKKFVTRKFQRTTVKGVGNANINWRINSSVFDASCQYLPGFKIVPPKTPEEWMGRWFTIDF
jgi:hypothetical protein